MRQNACVIEILLAGPSDVEKEIRVVGDEIAHWNASHSRIDNAFLEAIHWNTHAHPEVGDRPQALINRQIVDHCDLLIAIFWKSLGSPTGVAESGTIEEIGRFIESGKPVMIYFSEAAVPQKSNLKSFQKLQKYKASLNNILYADFKSSTDLRRKVSAHLSQAIPKIRSTTTDRSPNTTRSLFFDQKLSRLNAIEVELRTISDRKALSQALTKLRSLLLDCVELPKVTRFKEVRDNFQALLRRGAALSEFAANSPRFEEYVDDLFIDLRAAVEQAGAIEALSNWEVERYYDLKTKRVEHTKENAWNWPDERQCQCDDCKEFRSLQARIREDLNSNFRAFILQIEQELRRMPQETIIGDWIKATSIILEKFQDRFEIGQQRESAAAISPVITRLKSFVPHNMVDRYFEEPDEFEMRLIAIKHAIQPLRDLLGPWPQSINDQPRS